MALSLSHVSSRSHVSVTREKTWALHVTQRAQSSMSPPGLHFVFVREVYLTLRRLSLVCCFRKFPNGAIVVCWQRFQRRSQTVAYIYFSDVFNHRFFFQNMLFEGWFILFRIWWWNISEKTSIQFEWNIRVIRFPITWQKQWKSLGHFTDINWRNNRQPRNVLPQLLQADLRQWKWYNVKCRNGLCCAMRYFLSPPLLWITSCTKRVYVNFTYLRAVITYSIQTYH